MRPIVRVEGGTEEPRQEGGDCHDCQDESAALPDPHQPHVAPPATPLRRNAGHRLRGGR